MIRPPLCFWCLFYTNHEPICLYEKLWNIAGNFSGPPSPPIITNIDVNYNAIKVTWETPPSRQDTPITGHVLQIQKKQDQFKKWQDFKFSAKSNYFILRDLSKGMGYGVRLYANNVAGKSNVSDEKQVKTPLEGQLWCSVWECSISITTEKVNYTSNHIKNWYFITSK